MVYSRVENRLGPVVLYSNACSRLLFAFFYLIISVLANYFAEFKIQ